MKNEFLVTKILIFFKNFFLKTFVSDPIIDELEEYWPDLQFHSGSDYLWKHEWGKNMMINEKSEFFLKKMFFFCEIEKHGTCAADGTMASITDQYSFFSQALKFHTYLPIEVSCEEKKKFIHF